MHALAVLCAGLTFPERLREYMFSVQQACHLGFQNRMHSLHLNEVSLSLVRALAPSERMETKRMHVSSCFFIKAAVIF